jgi:glutathione S-transferase
MLVVHHLNASRSQRILWALEEIGVPYELRQYQRDPKTMLAPKELRNVHPLGKSPVVQDGNRILAESGAILEYLVETYGAQLRPSDPDALLQYRFWLHYAEGSAMPPLLLKLVSEKIRTAPVPFFLKPVVGQVAAQLNKQFIDEQLRTHLDFIESELGKREWFAGSTFSAADIQMSFPVAAALARGGSGKPHMQAFANKIHARPAYKRAIEKGGPFEIPT